VYPVENVREGNDREGMSYTGRRCY